MYINTKNAVQYRGANISQTTLPQVGYKQWYMRMVFLTGIMYMHNIILL